MMENETNEIKGVEGLTLLGLLFVGLKLGGIIDWSWWYVTLPFWGLAAAILVIEVGVLALVWIVEKVFVKRGKQ